MSFPYSRENPIQIIQMESDGSQLRHVNSTFPLTRQTSTKLSEKSYWKVSFQMALLPLLVLGLPVHLVWMKSPIYTRNNWIKSLANARYPGVLVLTIITFLMSGYINYHVLRNLFEIFYVLVIKGHLDPVVISNLFYLIQDLPIILLMDVIWVYGYVLRNLILSFTRPSESDSFLHNPDIVERIFPELPGKGKLIFMWIIIAFIHFIHFYMYSLRSKLESPDAVSVTYHFANYMVGPVFSTLFLPVYSTFAWACHRHYTILTSYVQNQISRRLNPNLIDFNRFKSAYKELSDRVQLVNILFSVYFSWVSFNVIISIWVEAWDLFNLFLVTISTPADPAEGNTSPPLFPPEIVRGFVVFLFIIMLKILLLGFTCWQVVLTNDMARELNVWLNDLVTEPSATLSISNYNAFRLLKFYVRSRMQQPLPALLRVPIAGCLPGLSARLNPTVVDQY